MLAQALTASIQLLSTAVAANDSKQKTSETSDGKIEHKKVEKLIKGARFLGTSSSTGVSGAYKWGSWDSYELVITEYDSSNNFKLTFTSTELRKELTDGPKDVPQFLSAWVSDLGEAVFNCSGKFNPKTQLLEFKADSVNIIKKAGSEWALRKYYLVLFNNLLIGTGFLETGTAIHVYTLQQF